MSASNRASKITKAHKVLKKHYKPVAPVDRPLLEHLLYACCLENAPFDAADEAFARLQEHYFDWNEVRVTTVKELAEIMNKVPDPGGAATRVKKVLQAVFETHYAFDIEFLKKQNLGKATKEVEQFAGVTPFVASYVVQNGLGGHAIPVNNGVLQAFVVLDIVSEGEAEQKKVPGLERAIPKTKGAEFASLVHQLGVDFGMTPHSPRVRTILLEIDADAKDRMPKRGKKDGEGEGDDSAGDAAPKRGARSGSAAGKSGKKTSGKLTSGKKGGSAKKSTKKTSKADAGSAESAKASKTLSKRKPR